MITTIPAKSKRGNEIIGRFVAFKLIYEVLKKMLIEIYHTIAVA